MVKYVITVNVVEGVIHVSVSRNGKFFDEAEFTLDERRDFIDYMTYITMLIALKAKEIKPSF